MIWIYYKVPHLDNVMDQGHAEIPIELYGVIFQYIFQTAYIWKTDNMV